MLKPTQKVKLSFESMVVITRYNDVSEELQALIKDFYNECCNWRKNYGFSCPSFSRVIGEICVTVKWEGTAPK